MFESQRKPLGWRLQFFDDVIKSAKFDQDWRLRVYLVKSE